MPPRSCSPIAVAVLALVASIPVHAQTSGTPSSASSGTSTLPQVEVNAVADTPAVAATEGTGLYVTPSNRASTGLTLSARDTPQSVTVITRQRIDDQDMRSLTDVLGSTPGIAVRNYDSERYSFTSRGFEIDNYQYDGIPTSFDTGYAAGESSVDPIIYDRVEIVRGATGLLSGAGNPSASVNLVRKHADSKVFTGSLSASVGSWNNHRVTADLSTPLSTDGRIRGRVVAAYQDTDSYLDHYSVKKQVLYGVVDADLTDRTLLSVGVNYQDNDPRGSSWGGFPLWYADGSRTNWRRSLNTGANWSSWASTTTGGFANLQHRFDNGWRVDAMLNHTKHENDAKLLYLYGWPDAVTGLGVGPSPAYYLGERKQTSVDLKASGPFSLFGRQHEAVVGVSRSKQDARFDSRAAQNPAAIGNFFAWNGSYPEPTWSNTRTLASSYTTEQSGFYAAGRFSLADPLRLIVGGRYSKWDTDALGWAGETRTTFNKDKFIPYAGLLYDLTPNLTAYTSYTAIFNPQSYQDRRGGWLDPVTGKSYEVGVKGEFLDGKLNTSAALFQIEQDNLAQTDPGFLVPGTINQAYAAAQGTKSRGIDLEMTGELAPGWNAVAGVSHWTAKDGDSKAIQTDQPRTLVRAFTTYRLPGALNRLTVGGGVNWQSKVYTIGSGPNGNERVEQGSYALVNLMARYEFSRQLSAQVNLNNLLGKKYYSQIGFYSQGAWGAPMSATATLNYKF